MGRSVIGVLLVALVIIGAAAGTGASQPNRQGSALPQTGDGLIAHVNSEDGQPQVVTLIDTRRRVMGVYHVDRSTGQITLKSVRNFGWDLQMLEFNSSDPKPQDVRDMQQGLQH